MVQVAMSEGLEGRRSFASWFNKTTGVGILHSFDGQHPTSTP